MDRRTFISLSALLPFFGFGKLIGSLSKDSSNSIFKRSLLKDPDKIVDLHHALKYRIISQKGLRIFVQSSLCDQLNKLSFLLFWWIKFKYFIKRKIKYLPLKINAPKPQKRTYHASFEPVDDCRYIIF